MGMEARHGTPCAKSPRRRVFDEARSTRCCEIHDHVQGGHGGKPMPCLRCCALRPRGSGPQLEQSAWRLHRRGRQTDVFVVITLRRVETSSLSEVSGGSSIDDDVFVVITLRRVETSSLFEVSGGSSIDDDEGGREDKDEEDDWADEEDGEDGKDDEDEEDRDDDEDDGKDGEQDEGGGEVKDEVDDKDREDEEDWEDGEDEEDKDEDEEDNNADHGNVATNGSERGRKNEEGFRLSSANNGQDGKISRELSPNVAENDRDISSGVDDVGSAARVSSRGRVRTKKGVSI